MPKSQPVDSPTSVSKAPDHAPWPDAADALGPDVLRSLRLTGGVFLEARLTEPWSLVTQVAPDKLKLALPPGARVIAFHYIIKGRLIGEVEGAPTADLTAGDLILLPRNNLHLLASARGLPPVLASELLTQPVESGILNLDHGGGGAEVHLICGFISVDPELDFILTALPPLITLPLEDMAAGAWMAESFAFAARGGKGGPADLARLSELMVGEVVRRHLESRPEEARGWLAGLRNPVVGKALALIHAQPSWGWSTERLARAVNLSRSAFAEHFSRTVGLPPMRYVTSWRMQLAAQALRETQKSIAQIAYDVGYEAEAAFTRAFRRERGLPPSDWRRHR